MKLNKRIAQSGLCSLRKAELFISEGRVSVNGKICIKNIELQKKDLVEVDGQPLRESSAKIVIAFNKPVGIVCTEEKIAGNIVDFIHYPERLFTVGRLDKDSEGLILLTNDGDLSNKIINSQHSHEKEYVVKLQKTVTSRFKIAQLESGIILDGQLTRPCTIERIDDFTYRFILTQGLNRQIRRMVERIGNEVVSLRRIRIMNIQLGDLPSGKWRELSEAELSELFKSIGRS